METLLHNLLLVREDPLMALRRHVPVDANRILLGLLCCDMLIDEELAVDERQTESTGQYIVIVPLIQRRLDFVKWRC